MARAFTAKTAVLAAVLALAGCEEMGMGSWLSAPEGEPQEGGIAASAEGVERDVEMPDVFNANDTGLWDGRPSLGGVWVAHPDVADPERVIIRNQANGQSVIGALFRRERDNPGPLIQVSSDAADALGMLAGQPAELNVVALRREEIPVGPIAADSAEPTDAGAGETAIAATPLEPITTTSLDGGPAEPALGSSLPPGPAPAAGTTVAAAPAAAPAATSTLDKPFIQIGIFSVEDNARNTATSLRNIGIIPTVLEQESQGKAFWRVIVGPSFSRDDQRVILGQVRELGFDDAYYVTN
ncbi:MAG: SPOR domain-containing protein [Pseudomonadota bacterium]